MTYPGNPELSKEAQDRVIAAFRQVITKLQEEEHQEALISLEFVLRLDPTFGPGVTLQEQLSSGEGAVDLASVIGQLRATDTDVLNLLLIEAVEDFEQNNYLDAKEKVGRILTELPGHAEARSLAKRIDEALKVSTQVGQFLAQAKEALAEGRPEEAANFVLMAQALDPHHTGIEGMLEKIREAGRSQAPDGVVPAEAPAPTGFETQLDEPQAGFESSEEAFEAPASEAAEFEAPIDPPDDRPDREPEDFDPGGDEPEADLGGDVADLFETSSDGLFESSSDSLFESSSDDLFESPADDFGWEADADAPPPAEASAGSDVDDLLAKGSAALEQGKAQDALHHLSRILLIEPDHAEAEALIDRARAEIDAMEQQLQSSLSEAELAWNDGDPERAKALIGEVLDAAPGHEEALGLQARFEGGAPEVPEAPAPPPPDVDDDRDLLTADPADAVPPPDFAPAPPPPAPTVPAEPAAKAGLSAPVRWIILGGGAVVVVLLGMWLGSMFLAGDGSDEVDSARLVTERIQRARKLMDQGRAEEALDYLESFEAKGIDKQRMDKQIAQIKAALAPPTPTPPPEEIEDARSLVDRDRWLEAYGIVHRALQDHPSDTGLLELKDTIASTERQLPALFAALGRSDFDSCVGIVGDLAEKHPDQSGFETILDRCLFNAALVQMRGHNMTGARMYLNRLRNRQPDDEEVERILQFVASYVNRPADMQLKIFVGSLEFR